MPLKIAVIGVGGRGIYYARTLKESFSREAQLVAICDRDSGQLARAREEIGGDVRAVEDYETLLEENLDAVVVATQDYAHQEPACKALEAGLHVLCEKPLGINVQQARKIVETAEQNERVLGVGFVLRYAPFFERIKELTQRNFGPIVSITYLELCGYLHGASYFRRWHRKRKYNGDLLNTKGCHDFDIINWLMDSRPRRVSAFGGTDIYLPKEGAGPTCPECCYRRECTRYRDFSGSPDREIYEDGELSETYSLAMCPYNSDKDSCDNAVVNIEYEGGKRASYTMSMTSPQETRKIIITGKRAELVGDFADHRIELRRVGSKDRIVHEIGGPGGGHGGGDDRLVDEFIRCIKEDRKPRTGGSEGIESTMVAEAALRSIISGGKLVDTADL